MNQSSSEARPHNCFVPRLGTSVIAVPPLARHGDLRVSRAENAKMIQYLKQGGVRTLLYGGNAVFYHIRPSEYAAAVEMLLEEAGEDMWMIPSSGPAFGTMLEQAELLASMPIDTAMVLPQKEITDPEGIEMGIRHVVERLGKPVVLYLKIDRWLSPAAVARLVRDGMVSWIKYAVVLPDASNDPYLRELLEVVPADLMVSGMGEQPAIVHMQDFGMSSFTSGCVCIAPSLSTQMLRDILRGDIESADSCRKLFAPLEDLRNKTSPIRVLHEAVASSGVLDPGPVMPLLSSLTTEQRQEIDVAVKRLMARPS
ncbi:MAG: dihydrodipicolinate synthase family protein [Pirellula sp.]